MFASDSGKQKKFKRAANSVFQRRIASVFLDQAAIEMRN